MIPTLDLIVCHVLFAIFEITININWTQISITVTLCQMQRTREKLDETCAIFTTFWAKTRNRKSGNGWQITLRALNLLIAHKLEAKTDFDSVNNNQINKRVKLANKMKSERKESNKTLIKQSI